jgi:Mn-dependent DtxR family transcriptional regulator
MQQPEVPTEESILIEIEILIAQGLMRQTWDGSYELTEAGRQKASQLAQEHQGPRRCNVRTTGRM